MHMYDAFMHVGWRVEGGEKHKFLFTGTDLGSDGFSLGWYSGHDIVDVMMDGDSICEIKTGQVFRGILFLIWNCA